jgi:hypothetical protein
MEMETETNFSTLKPPSSSEMELRPREWWRNASKRLFFFMTEVLSSAWQDKFQNFGVLQKHLCRFLENKKSKKKFISIFRGSFKTTVILGYCLFLFCWAVANGESLSICYNTSSKDNAAIFSDFFRQTLVNCKRLHWIFPEIPTDPSKYLRWTQKMIEYKAVKFHVASLDTRQVMRHYGIIINDDLVNDDNAFSETERKSIIRKWKLQKSILTKYKKFDIGLEIDVGTPYHHKDLVSYIMRDVSTYEKFIIPYALSDERGRLDIKSGIGILTMPEMYVWEDFQEKRIEMGPSLFATQYEIKVIDDMDKLCNQDWIKYWTDLPKSYQRIMIVDPGGLDKDDDQSNGIFIGDVDPAGYIYSLFAEEVGATPVSLLKLMGDLKAQYDPDEIYMEREKAEIVLAGMIDLVNANLPWTPVSPYGRDKNSRIKRIKQYVETGRFLLSRGMTTLEDRLLNFPDCPKHLLDCVAHFITVMNPPKKGVDRTPEERRTNDFVDEMMTASRYFKGREEESGLENDGIF